MNQSKLFSDKVTEMAAVRLVNVLKRNGHQCALVKQTIARVSGMSKKQASKFVNRIYFQSSTPATETPTS